ncbi:2-methoxy-6-polyprenyl-1,4-benzoquinol methylase, mitochondrial [subsurface metagenome]
MLPHIRGRLLDIGCGTNKLVKFYMGEGIGVDVYQWGGGDVDLLFDNSAKLPFKNETFDTVTIVGALNHIPNRSEVLAEAHRILRQMGELLS